MAGEMPWASLLWRLLNRLVYHFTISFQTSYKQPAQAKPISLSQPSQICLLQFGEAPAAGQRLDLESVSVTVH